MKTEKFIVTGMTCAACQANVTKTVGRLNGVGNVDVNLLTGRMSVDYDEALLSAKDITDAVISLLVRSSRNPPAAKALIPTNGSAGAKAKKVHSNP